MGVLAFRVVEGYIDVDVFQSFVEKELSDSNLLNINYLIVRSWVAQLLDTGVAARSVNRKLSSLKSFYKYLLQIRKALHLNSLMSDLVQI